MEYFPDPSNITDPVGLFNWANNVSSITNTSGTVVIGGFFSIGILISIWAVFFLGFKNYYGTERAFVSANFIAFVSSVMMWIMGFIGFNIVGFLSLITAFGIFLLYASEG